ncbi:MAG: hypothetical protein KGO81_10670 [Bacteroidota bacterium]|nr:hypothetical protein [Bacteroidota bacterium]
MKTSSMLLVSIQFACIGWFLFTAQYNAFHLVDGILLLGSILLAISALLVMRWKNFTIMPEPKKSISLITKGPYAFVRHPMYSSVLLFCLSLLLTDPSLIQLSVYIILLSDLVIKIHKEEKYLSAKFPEYGHYSTTTKRILPFIW